MSSSAKQQKRAKRAKAKARQQRIQRSNHSLAAPQSDWPDDYRDISNYDEAQQRHFRQNQALFAMIEDWQPEEEPPEAVLEFFQKVQQAEVLGLEDMLETLVKGPLGTPSVLQDILDGKLFHLLSRYWKWSEGLDDKTILARVEALQFDAALASVLSPLFSPDGEDEITLPDELAQELEALIEAESEFILEHYHQLQEAEAVSQEQFLKVLLQGPLLPREDEFGNKLNEEEFTEQFTEALVLYWEWSEGIDEAGAEQRMLSGQFRQDLERALISTQTAPFASEPQKWH